MIGRVQCDGCLYSGHPHLESCPEASHNKYGVEQSDSDLWRKQYLGEWTDTNDHVFSREQVSKLLDAGYISKEKAEYLLRLRYELRRDKVEIRDYDDCLVEVDEIRYYKTLV